jgi:hypothetical protein
LIVGKDIIHTLHLDIAMHTNIKATFCNVFDFTMKSVLVNTSMINDKTLCILIFKTVKRNPQFVQLLYKAYID